ncbi:MAG: serine/threonine protein kinase [Ardenticatenaceae bacterium]
MPGQSKRYLLLLLAVVSAVGTLISAFFVFAQQNQQTLQDAIERGQVTVQIHGITEDGRFSEPMVEVTLSKKRALPLTVVIPQSLTLQSASDTADMVILQSEKITLLGTNSSRQIFGYTLDYTKSFPNHKSEYEATSTINEDLKRVLNNIVGLKAEHELASQLAVWMRHNNVELEPIGAALGRDFSEYADRVNEILQASYPPAPSPLDSWLWLAALILCAGLTLIFGTLYWKSAPPKKMVDQLTNWELLAEGGMAQVWTAQYKRGRAKQNVIVKFPREASKEIHAKTIDYRFKIEVQEHKRLSHPNIVPLLEDGRSTHPESKKESRYLIQEFVDGCTLDKLLNQQAAQRLPESIIFEIIDKVLAALGYIHEQRVVHRDVTLKNIMIAKTGQVYLIDFGNSTSIDSKETIVKGIPSVGTVPFYAPDNIRNVPQRDFYALAIVIYAMYGGQLIRGEIQQTSAVKKTIEQELNHLESIPSSLRLVLQHCLNGYYESSAALRKALSLPELSQMVIGAEKGNPQLGHLSSKVGTKHREEEDA